MAIVFFTKNCLRPVTVTVTRRSALWGVPPCPAVASLKRARRFCVGLSDSAYNSVSKKHIGSLCCTATYCTGRSGSWQFKSVRVNFTLTSTDVNKMRRCITWLTRAGSSGSSGSSVFNCPNIYVLTYMVINTKSLLNYKPLPRTPSFLCDAQIAVTFHWVILPLFTAQQMTQLFTDIFYRQNLPISSPGERSPAIIFMCNKFCCWLYVWEGR